MTKLGSRSNPRSSSLTSLSASKKPPPLDAASPSKGDMAQFWEYCNDQVSTPSQKLRPTSDDPLAIHRIVTWRKMAKDQSLALKAHERFAAFLNQGNPKGTDLVEKLPSLEEDDSSQRVRVNPVTMEPEQEMLILPRPTSPTRIEISPSQEEEFAEECSPNKAYMMRHGSFPGSSHIVGENALLLMSSIY